MVDRLISPLISTSDIDNAPLSPDQYLSYFTDKTEQTRNHQCILSINDHPFLPPLSLCDSSMDLESFTPVTAFLSLSKVIGQLCATAWLFDPMPKVLRKAVIPELIPFIESLINTSLPSGYVPLQFQMAVVTKQTKNTMLKYL